jgi:4-hydroxybenzoate polyprenyltransferase
MAPGRRTGARALGWLRVTHPFPSVLDGLVSGATAAVAGAPAGLAFQAGLAMTCLQLGIGTVNDLVDAPFDAGRKPGKPIPAGLVPAEGARALAVAAFGSGVVLALVVSPLVGGLAIVVIAIGLAYDLRLKGTSWSWLPFAVGIPILPVFGWVAATGSVPSLFAVLVPLAMAAGAALAIGNAIVDVERDRAAGRSSVAVALGPARASTVAIVLQLIVLGGAVVTAAGAAVGMPVLALIAGLGAVPVATAARARTVSSARRERLWQVQALSLAGFAVAWLGAVLGSGSVLR